MRCAIVPPHILENISVRSSDPRLREIARRSLITDTALRTERRTVPPIAPGELAPSTTAAPNRTIKDAKHQQLLPGETVRNEGSGSTGDPAVDQDYDWLGATFELYNTAYGRNSIDGAG